MSECLFCRIIARKVPAQIVFEDELAVAIKDINPQAPAHVLVIPRKHVPTLLDLGDDDAGLLGHLQLVAVKLAREEKLEESGFRVVTNCGEGAGQSIFHIHLHLLGGRPLRWPPG